ncbi:alpha/beta hydrolase [Candidatus Palauibacter sp.]|uniref:alpha/beta hydrolase n=1 Tax=Candidatus Palauibacter sp. TaxID=3101350 RepID=UPI003AF30A35
MSIEPRHMTIERRVRYAVLEPPERPMTEVWFVLHGYNQLAHRFLRYFQPIHTGSRCVVAAEGLHRQYIDHAARRIGASWMTSEDRITDIEDYVAYLDRLHAHILAEESRPRRGGSKPVRIVGLGFSQGVHTLCRWLAFGRARIDRAVLWGSTVPPDLDLAAHGAALSGADLQLVAGDRDEFFDSDAIAAHEERLREAGIAFTAHSYAGGHRLDAGVLRRLARPT